MKTLLTLLISLPFLIYSCANKVDPELDTFITEKGYQNFSHSESIPPLVQPYYASIVDYMAWRLMVIDEYYLFKAPKINSDSILEIPLIHIEGVEKEMEFEKEKQELEAADTSGGYRLYTHLGNWSGVDGTLKLDNKTGEILGFYYWR